MRSFSFWKNCVIVPEASMKRKGTAITMKLSYKPAGVCSQRMDVEVTDGVVTRVKVTGGCSGNLQGISRLVVGMKAEEAIARLSGIRCGNKKTSCPDQLAKALTQCLAGEREG